jgi:hypothetical protein
MFLCFNTDLDTWNDSALHQRHRPKSTAEYLTKQGQPHALHPPKTHCPQADPTKGKIQQGLCKATEALKRSIGRSTNRRLGALSKTGASGATMSASRRVRRGAILGNQSVSTHIPPSSNLAGGKIPTFAGTTAEEAA